MKQISLNLDKSNKNIQIIHDKLRSAHTELTKNLNDIFNLHIFENVHTLHPRKLAEFAEREIQNFLNFFNDFDLDKVTEFGKKQAAEGLGLPTIMSINTFLSQYCLELSRDDHKDIANSALLIVNTYMGAYLTGYHSEVKNQTLQQQKELRYALSVALEEHRNQLFIQNYALNTSINAILLTDLNGKVSYVNQAFLDLWGYKKLNEVLGKSSLDVIKITDAKKILKALHNKNNWRGELKAKKKNGTKFDIEMFASVIKDDLNQLIGNMMAFVDITERKRLEAQFRQAQKMEALGLLASGIAHDFNNLLTIIKGFLQIISLELDKETQLYDDIMQLKIAVDRGAGLTKQLRYFTKEATGERVPTDLNILINDSYEILKHSFPPDIEILLDLEPDLWKIEADPSLLSHILMNFCVNARDAIFEKQQKMKKLATFNSPDEHAVKLQTRNIILDEVASKRFLKAAPGNYVQLKIEDTGIGMKNDILDRIFEPFFSTKKTQKSSGLGLSIVYNIIQKHDGFIDVQSDFGAGSVFDIYFPVLNNMEIIENISDGVFTDISSQDKTILVIDDEVQVLTLLERFLNKYGYNVLKAPDGVEAIDIFKKHYQTIDLVILDIVMPDIDGCECFEELYKIDPAVKVLLSTGNTLVDPILPEMKEKIIDVLEKPFDFPILTRTIQNIIKN